MPKTRFSEAWVCRKPARLRPYATIARFSAYSYRVWITLIKLFYAPLRYLKTKPDIHQGERLCGRLLPSVLRVSEKNSSRQLAEQAPSPARHIPSLGHCFYHCF